MHDLAAQAAKTITAGEEQVAQLIVPDDKACYNEAFENNRKNKIKESIAKKRQETPPSAKRQKVIELDFDCHCLSLGMWLQSLCLR